MVISLIYKANNPEIFILGSRDGKQSQGNEASPDSDVVQCEGCCGYTCGAYEYSWDECCDYNCGQNFPDCTGGDCS